jgi:hypothetical protein
MRIQNQREMSRSAHAPEEAMHTIVSSPSTAIPASQLFLPFTERQPLVEPTTPPAHTGESNEGNDCRKETQHDLLSDAVIPLPPPSARLGVVREYLRRHFPDFVIQQRSSPSGSAQLTLYRIPDGTLYRMTIESRFLEDDGGMEETERFFEVHGLQQKLPASMLSPILLDRDGIHLPRPPAPPEEAPAQLRSSLGWTLLARFMEATGLSSPLTKKRSPS